uniref:Uncharacterized protein n=1 Tax=Arundo donax TaxID=35708 RepID=A0A0A9AF57_ARUDO
MKISSLTTRKCQCLLPVMIW